MNCRLCLPNSCFVALSKQAEPPGQYVPRQEPGYEYSRGGVHGKVTKFWRIPLNASKPYTYFNLPASEKPAPLWLGSMSDTRAAVP